MVNEHEVNKLSLCCRSEDFKTGNNVREFSGQEPTRTEGRLDEITNTWKDVKRGKFVKC